MTNEEAIKILKKARLAGIVDVDINRALDMAIKALEQTDVLDKIRAEIDDEADFAYCSFNVYKEEILHAEPDELPNDDFRWGLRRAIDIIDKYMEESEGAE